MMPADGTATGNVVLVISAIPSGIWIDVISGVTDVFVVAFMLIVKLVFG